MPKIKLASWNVNGIRSAINKGALQAFISEYQPDVLCLQEIKAKPAQVEYDFAGYQVFWNPAVRPGYSGTATLVSQNICQFITPKRYIPTVSPEPTAPEAVSPEPTAPEAVSPEPTAPGSAASGIQPAGFSAHQSVFLENSLATQEGRVLVLDLEKFYLVNVYTPNSKPDLSRLELRETDWDPTFLELLRELERSKPVVTCGDFNAAHTEIDLARPKDNIHSAGFTEAERRGIDHIVGAGFIDTFRSLHPDSRRYTWWTWRAGARARNIGWRIDYFFISSSLKSHLRVADIMENVTGSDHCPVIIDLEF